MPKKRKENTSFKVVKTGKYLKFICDCGSEMWDNRYSKKNPKAPDLRCKDDNCSKGWETDRGWSPNAVWLTEKQKEKLNMGSGNSYKGGDNGIPVSMYAAWAKDIAVFLGKTKGIKTSEEFDTLYRECLVNTEKTLSWFQGKLTKKKGPKEEQVREVASDEVEDVEETDNLDVDITDVEDVEEEVEEKEEDSIDVDDDFSGLEDVDGI